MPASLAIGSHGILLMGRGCSTCFEQGGGQVPQDEMGMPTSGRPKLVTMFGPGGRVGPFKKPTNHVESFEDWVRSYGHLRFGSPIDSFLRVYRFDLEGLEDTRDLSIPRTPEQIKEAETATRYFPCWEGKVPDHFRGVKFTWER